MYYVLFKDAKDDKWRISLKFANHRTFATTEAYSSWHAAVRAMRGIQPFFCSMNQEGRPHMDCLRRQPFDVRVRDATGKLGKATGVDWLQEPALLK